LGTGMGGSIFINRQLHTGSHMYGGEFGMSLNSNGETGSKNGTLVAATNKYNEEMGTNLDGIQLLDLYDQGQPEAVKTIDQMFNAIAEILYNVQVIIDPDIIVLGGGISNRASLSEELAERMDKHLEELDILGAKPKIVNAQYKNDANLYGAVTLLLSQVFQKISHQKEYLKRTRNAAQWKTILKKPKIVSSLIRQTALNLLKIMHV